MQQVTTESKKEAARTSAWKTILAAAKSDDVNCNCQGVAEQQVEPEPAPKDDDDMIITVLQKLIADYVKSQVAIALATIPSMTEEAGKQQFRESTIGGQGRVRDVVYEPVEHDILN